MSKFSGTKGRRAVTIRFPTPGSGDQGHASGDGPPAQPTGGRMIYGHETGTAPQCIDTDAARSCKLSRRNSALRNIIFGVAVSMITPASAQHAPRTPGVTGGGQALFGSVTDEQLINTLVMGEYLLIVCKEVPLPKMTVQVLMLREEIIMRYGAAAKHAVAPAVKQMLAKNPNVNTAACVDSPSVDF